MNNMDFEQELDERIGVAENNVSVLQQFLNEEQRVLGLLKKQKLSLTKGQEEMEDKTNYME